MKTLAAPILPRLRHEVLPKLNAGPSQIIHNDAHPHNLLRADAVSQDVVGLIDFGDMVHASSMIWQLQPPHFIAAAKKTWKLWKIC